ncbi:hypothetical protein BPNPMPFG_008262 (plasmid) [Mesorhizobium sp. AR07]|uniref:hypothetical protein n=1 Tax=Mesorhizobium sp. AR07 TaxID=2865838 RepID=UPI00215FC359|nr:hypothetical protein [Mesorhizobium sp. AR07]UVK49323.1 hypothetical protein BPNPMPFG_008262 [Mesorhizobium sp. AR07]
MAVKEKQPAYAIYSPPTKGLPFLAVVLAPNGTVTAKQFSTADEASDYNSRLAKSRHGGTTH